MIYSKTTEYAIRALSYISSKERGVSIGAREVSRSAGIPGAYTAKIFQALARSGILESSRGRGGGFMLKGSPAEISLWDILSAVDNLQASALSECLMGLNHCDHQNPCPLHHIWSKTSKEIVAELRRNNLLDAVNLIGLFPTGKRKRHLLSRKVRSVFRQGKS